MSEDALLQLLQIVGITLLIALPLGLILYAGALWDRTTRVARRLHLAPPPAQGPAGPPIERIAADVRRIRHQLLSLPPGVPAARLRGWRAAYDDVLGTACHALQFRTRLLDLPAGTERDLERERVERLLERAGMRIRSAA